MAQGFKVTQNTIKCFICSTMTCHFLVQSLINMLIAKSHIVAAILLHYISTPWPFSEKLQGT